MNKFGSIVATLLGLTGIAIGAFAAHGLKPLIGVESLQTFETGVRYQMYHALFLLCISVTNFLSKKQLSRVVYLTLIGVVFFSGSIYGLATNALTSFDFGMIGFVTPIGGLLLLSAWLLVLISAFKLKKY
ncbi:DUF423 domain-containing protein [Winogradskyella sp. A3E31]|uniref:DUF423 domain-containing protein n=1 Tax=Winogradskyella sp. A3E31 TaxID=3349637 RepID=UPI00398B6301